MSIDPNWIAAIIAALALVFSIFANRSAEKSKERTDALELKSVELADMQNRLAHQSWSDEYFREITSWACQVSTALSTAIHLVGRDDEQVRNETLITLSACIDMGRWYFPNTNHNELGMHKEPAYRGLRQPVLDWLVWAYDIIDGGHHVSDSKAELITCQRNFVSCIQEILDPRSREKAIERVLQNFSAVASLPKVQSPKE